MAISTLNRAQAFGIGSDLWIIPDEKNFSFFNKLDWYLNFQLTRAHLHKTESVSPQLKNITNENNLPEFSPSLEKKSALMVSSEMNLPTKFVIEIPAQAQSLDWVNLVHQSWLNLNRPPLRVFMPAEMSAAEFSKLWPGPKNEDLTLVPT